MRNKPLQLARTVQHGKTRLPGEGWDLMQSDTEDGNPGHLLLQIQTS